MGYCIEYQPIKKVRDVQKRTSLRASLTMLFLSLFLLTVHLHWDDGKTVFQRLLLPKENGVTAEAFEVFSYALKNGTSTYEAIQAFIQTILP